MGRIYGSSVVKHLLPTPHGKGSGLGTHPSTKQFEDLCTAMEIRTEQTAAVFRDDQTDLTWGLVRLFPPQRFSRDTKIMTYNCDTREAGTCLQRFDMTSFPLQASDASRVAIQNDSNSHTMHRQVGFVPRVLANR